MMTSWARAVGFGLLCWLFPFAVAFAVFPLREPNRPLFESVMAVAVTATAVVLGLAYLGRVRTRVRREGLLVGVLWFLICVAVDAPLMLLGGPMKMTFGAYMADIGVTYLIIPVATVGLALAVQRSHYRPDTGSA